MHPPKQGYFITGSDTDVGKTWIARQIIGQINSKYGSVKVRKPVESGCEKIDGEYFPADGNALYQSNNQAENLTLVTPYRFHAALAPDRAARMENYTLTLEQLYKACLNQVTADDTLLVEGAGGFYSPICEDGLNADLARALGLKVIIVCEDRLGAINQALLTISAVKQEGLDIQAVILNQNKPPVYAGDSLDNYQDLCQRTDIPVYTCAYQSGINGQVI
jgi:dethiobiotin synthetase